MPVKQSSFFWNAARTQRAVVIYADSWTYVLDNNNRVVDRPPQENQFTRFCQDLITAGYTSNGAPTWNLPAEDPPRN